jgi:hypothetical protein
MSEAFHPTLAAETKADYDGADLGCPLAPFCESGELPTFFRRRPEPAGCRRVEDNNGDF